jgi:hypothetical protein
MAYRRFDSYCVFSLVRGRGTNGKNLKKNNIIYFSLSCGTIYYLMQKFKLKIRVR